MKNTKLKMMAVALCLTVGLAFAGCSAETSETTKEKEETTTTTSEETTTTEEETTTTTEEETEADETMSSEDIQAQIDEIVSSFENETVQAYALDCCNREIGIFPVTPDMLSSGELNPDDFVEGFVGMGGDLSVSAEVDEEGNAESDATGTNFTVVECCAFTSYDVALSYVDQIIPQLTGESDVELETEETDAGYTFSGEIEENGEVATIDGIVTPDGVLYLEVTTVA